MDDGFEEANLLLSSALEQLEDVLREKGSRGSPLARSRASPRINLANQLNNNQNASSRINRSMKDVDEGLDLDNGNAGRDADDERSSKGVWRSDWRDRRGSDGSSGVESPPSDIPTSSSSLSNAPKVYQEFIKAIDENSILERPDLETRLKIMKWMNGRTSPSPSMSTVSCPEYPELQEKLHRLAMARDSLTLQVSVLSEEVGAQKEKIRDLETLLAQKRSKLTSTDELLQEKLRGDDSASELSSRKMDLLAELSSLKLKFATLEREKNETERKLKMSQNEMDHVNQSMHGMVVQHQLQTPHAGYMPSLREHQNEKRNDEMDHLRHAVQRLIADNEHKSMQINNLRTALDEQIRVRQCQNEDLYPAPRWKEQPYDLNSQIRRLLMDEPSEPMSHSTSFPVSLCSSSIPHMPRSTVQSSSSYTSSLSAASPQHSWNETPRHMLHPSNQNIRNEQISYRSPSSPAARQLAAELDELRRIGDQTTNQNSYSSASLPRGMGTKAASTLTLPPKKFSLATGSSTGELRRPPSSVGGPTQRNYREQMNKWFAGKLKKSKRATSAPNLVESDDEVARGRTSTTASQASSGSQLKPLRRDRTRSSLRNLFSKLTRSSSQDQNGAAFRRGSAARSTSSARLCPSGPLSGAIAIRPPLSQFVDWRQDQLCEWMGEVGFAQYVPEVAKHARSGRHLLNLSLGELESLLGMRNPIHRKRLRILLRNIEDDVIDASSKWDVHQTLGWLEEIGLPQYKETFAENLVDGPLLVALTAADMVEMRITNAHHYLCISRSVQFLKNCGFKSSTMERKFDPSITSSYPCPERVVRWSHAATCEWLRTIDLAEFTPNLLCAGTPGALMVYEPTFTAESMAEILQMPAQKTLLRRHLTSHFNQLLGQKIISEKRDFLASGVYPQLLPANRIKVVKIGFSLTRKKVKNELCLEPDEPICSNDESQKLITNGDNTSLESSNV